MDLQTATPRQIDEQIVEILTELAAAEARQDSAMNDVHYSARDRKQRVGRRTCWTMTDGQAVRAAEARAADESEMPWDRDSASSAIAKLAERGQIVIDIKKRLIHLDAEYINRGGWTRYYAVAGGHIHADAHCKTLHREGKATRLGWMPELSGQTMAQAIAHFEAQGAGRSVVLCSVCMPDAPVSLFEKPADPTVCPGSGGQYKPGTTRFGYAAGNGGECPTCGKWVGGTPGKVRKHKR